MLKILIVDDEFVERDGIVFLINKFSLELDVKECCDGEEALKYMEQNSIDILFTDVKMPFMDGLELSRNAKKLYPNLKIIIFSGFGEFEYAKTAISIGVSNYILKPINQFEFKNTIEKVIDEVKNEKKENEQKELRSFSEKEHVLLKIINGTPIEEISKKFSFDNCINFIEEYKRIILMESNNDFFQNHQQFIKEILNNMDIKADYLNLNPKQSIFFIVNSVDEHILEKICMKIHNKIINDYEINCYFAISKVLTSPHMISEAYSNIEQIIERRFFISNKYVFCESLELSLESTDEKFDDTMVKNIQHDINVKDFCNLRKHVDFLIKKFSAKNTFSQIYVKFILTSIYQNIYQEIQKVSEVELNDKIDKIYFCRTIEEINDILISSINLMEKKFSKELFNNRHEIELIKSYIYKNYGSDLSLERLAEYIYMTPSYLSSIFKKETGMGINNFIKNYRMEKAKDMLENTNIKIKDIGNIVGYSNTSYFCQSFKEFYGLTPEKYRQRDD